MAGLDDLMRSHPAADLRREARSAGREERVRNALGDVEDRLAGLDRLASGPRAERLSTEAWQAIVAARERGEAYARLLEAIRADRERSLLGLRQAGHYLGPALRGHLGLEPDQGFLVTGVAPRSPAAGWGIEAWDVVLSIDGVAVSDLDLFWMRYEALPEGRSVEIEWIHRGQLRRAEVMR